MMSKSRNRKSFVSLHLQRLEDRLAPAGIISLVSQAEPSLYADTGGANSYIDHDPESGPRMPHNYVSADGRYTVLLSNAPNLISAQLNTPGFDTAQIAGGGSVFVYDHLTHVAELISHKAGATATVANGVSLTPVISGDGRYVAFLSQATDLIPGMVNTQPNGSRVKNLYLYDRQTGTMTLASHASSNLLNGASANCIYPWISADGQVISFSSQANNLTAGVPNQNTFHAYQYDRTSGQVILLDHANGSTTAANNFSIAGMMTPDGRYTLLLSLAKNLQSTLTAGKGDVYRYDRQTSSLLLVSKSSGSAPWGGNALSQATMISDDGRWVAFQSAASNLAGGSSVANQVYITDLNTGAVTVVSHTPAGATSGGNAASINPVMSSDGRYVAYMSQATNVVTSFTAGHSSATYDYYYYDRLTDQTKLLSHAAGSSTMSDNAGASPVGFAAISGDGGTVIFPDLSTNLVSGFVDNNGASAHDLYRFDRTSGTVTLFSGHLSSNTIGGNQESQFVDISVNGSTIVWSTAASDMMSGLTDTNVSNDVYIRDAASGATDVATRRIAISLTAGSLPAQVNNGVMPGPKSSADGRYIVYTSAATNLVPGQQSGEQMENVFLTDRVSGTTVLVSHAYDSTIKGANDQSGVPVISADGRYIAYCSWAGDLIPNFVDGNGGPVPGTGPYTSTDVFLYDRLTGVNTLVSHQAGNLNVGGNYTSGTFSPFPDWLLAINADGRYVAYRSIATDLVAGQIDTNMVVNNVLLNDGVTGEDVFVYDRTTGANTLVSHAAGSAVTAANGISMQPHISDDGQYISYQSRSTELIANFSGVTASLSGNAYLFDQQTGTNTLVGHAANSVASSGDACGSSAVISGDGRYVVFDSQATNIVTGQVDNNGLMDIFRYDRQSGINVLVSHTPASGVTTGNQYSSLDSGLQLITTDGNLVVFGSFCSNLVAGFVGNNSASMGPNIGGPRDVYLFDATTGSVTLVSHALGLPSSDGNKPSSAPSISADGRFIVYATNATDLGPMPWTINLPAYEADGVQVALLDRWSGITTLVSHSMSGQYLGGNWDSYDPWISATGSVITFASMSYDLVPGDLNDVQDVFAYVQQPPTITSVAFGSGNSRSLVKQLVVTFSEPVSFMGSVASAFTVHRTGTNGTLGDVTLAASPSTGHASSVTITFSGSLTEYGSLVDGLYDVWVDAAQVSGVGGALDGNSDGVAGGSYHLVGATANKSYRLFGDSNGDAAVDQNDYLVFRDAISAGPSQVFDFDNSGDVDQSDYLAFRERIGMSP
ncbi:MAG: hypothetical protein ACJ8C4_15645 [Gemmataceae bacterium]